MLVVEHAGRAEVKLDFICYVYSYLFVFELGFIDQMSLQLIRGWSPHFTFGKDGVVEAKRTKLLAVKSRSVGLGVLWTCSYFHLGSKPGRGVVIHRQFL